MMDDGAMILWQEETRVQVQATGAWRWLGCSIHKLEQRRFVKNCERERLYQFLGENLTARGVKYGGTTYYSIEGSNTTARSMKIVLDSESSESTRPCCLMINSCSVKLMKILVLLF